VAPFLRKKNPYRMSRVVISATLLLGCGCIMSPDINVEPQEVLYPPEIILSTLSPGDRFSIYDLDVGCPQAVFKVDRVRDLNKKDDLYARFLEDWKEDDNKSSFVTLFIYPVPGQVDRTAPGVEWQLDLTRYTLGVTHSLRLFVSDSEPRNDGNGMQMPDGSDGQYDFYQWTFRVVEEGSGICASESNE